MINNLSIWFYSYCFIVCYKNCYGCTVLQEHQYNGLSYLVFFFFMPSSMKCSLILVCYYQLHNYYNNNYNLNFVLLDHDCPLKKVRQSVFHASESGFRNIAFTFAFKAKASYNSKHTNINSRVLGSPSI